MDKVEIVAQNYWKEECDDIRNDMEDLAKDAYLRGFRKGVAKAGCKAKTKPDAEQDSEQQVRDGVARQVLAAWTSICTKERVDELFAAEKAGRVLILKDAEKGCPKGGTECLIRVSPAPESMYWTVESSAFWTVATYCGEGVWEADNGDIWHGIEVTYYAVLNPGQN